MSRAGAGGVGRGQAGAEGLGPSLGVQGCRLSACRAQALNEEKAAYDRSPSKNIYLNLAVNTLKKLRGLGPSGVPGLSSKSGRRRRPRGPPGGLPATLSTEILRQKAPRLSGSI